MTGQSNDSFDRTITVAYATVTGMLALWICTNGIWDGELFDGHCTYLIELDRAPAWKPPEPPEPAKFVEAFRVRHELMPEDMVIRTHLKWDFMLLDFLLWFWGVSILFGVVSLSTAAGRHSISVYLIRWVAVSLTGAAAASVVLWEVAGGWGPPEPFHFAFGGIIAGIGLGIREWSQQESRSAREGDETVTTK